jgi:hypothetical protein
VKGGKNFKFLTSIYDLYAPFNMGRFRLDRVSTEHLVYVCIFVSRIYPTVAVYVCIFIDGRLV